MIQLEETCVPIKCDAETSLCDVLIKAAPKHVDVKKKIQ
jgi:hypothetical protein